MYVSRVPVSIASDRSRLARKAGRARARAETPIPIRRSPRTGDSYASMGSLPDLGPIFAHRGRKVKGGTQAYRRLRKSGLRFALLPLLQRSHSVCRLLMALLPPLARGTM